MSTARPSLAAEHREVTGKRVAHLRRAGKLPAVVYGHGVGSANVTIDAHEFEVLRKHVGPNALVDLRVDGKRAQPVLVHDVQVHPVNRRPLHVDLFLVRMTEELTVDVPLEPIGEAPAVSLHGGTLQALDHVRVKALPDRLPQFLEIPIDQLADFDAVLHVRDLTVPSDVTLLTDPDEILAKVLPPRIEEVEVPAEAEEAAEAVEAAEAAEGEAAPAEAAGPEGEGSTEG